MTRPLKFCLAGVIISALLLCVLQAPDAQLRQMGLGWGVCSVLSVWQALVRDRAYTPMLCFCLPFLGFLAGIIV